jgi:hypothetical protein
MDDPGTRHAGFDRVAAAVGLTDNNGPEKGL